MGAFPAPHDFVGPAACLLSAANEAEHALQSFVAAYTYAAFVILPHRHK